MGGTGTPASFSRSQCIEYPDSTVAATALCRRVTPTPRQSEATTISGYIFSKGFVGFVTDARQSEAIARR
jgi:hypothetical protein